MNSNIYRKNANTQRSNTKEAPPLQKSITTTSKYNQYSQVKTNRVDDKNWIGDIPSESPSQFVNKKGAQQFENVDLSEKSNFQNHNNDSKNINPMSNIKNFLPKKTLSPQTQQLSKVSVFSKNNSQSPLAKLAASLYRNGQESRISQINQKSPSQLMNDIFRGIGINHMQTSKAYHSKQSQQTVTQLLSNPNKMNNYLKKISAQMSEAQPQVSKNYEVLLILLQQLSLAQIEVEQDENGLKINFNRSQLAQKQKHIQQLEKELQQKKKQTQKVVQEYESVIRNFNDVMEKLVAERKF